MARRSKDITIFRIAEEAGVSVPTVSRVINRRAGIAEETRSRVNDLLIRYNYRPDYPAMKTVKIAAVFHSTREISDYAQRALRSIYAYTNEQNLLANVISAESERRESLLDVIRDLQCSGVIAFQCESYIKDLDSLRDIDIPVIALDSSLPISRNLGFIDNDSYSGSAAATNYLLEQGHRRIGYINYCKFAENVNHFQRYKGYENAMAAAGVDILPQWTVSLSEEMSSVVRGMCGYNGMKRLLADAPELTAVMTSDDSMALGALTAIHESGKNIPQDISVIGFDNYAETACWYPALTTVEHAVERECKMAVDSIIRYLHAPGEWLPPQEIVPTRLVVRKSSGPVGM